MKKIILCLVILLTSVCFTFADDVQYLRAKVQEVSQELGLNLVITGDYRSWDRQIDLMWTKDESTLKKWYGSETASAFMKYKSGNISKDTLLSIMKNNTLIKHPNGLAVDIGINSSGLNNSQAEEVKKALQAKGLYVFNEINDGTPCIHISRSKY